MQIKVGNDIIDIKPPSSGGKGGLIIILVIVLAIAAFTSIYSIGTEEEGVVLRFGKIVKTVNSGLHLKLPFGIDRVYPVPVTRVMKQEFGFGTKGATYQSQMSSDWEMQLEKDMVTGDLNSALVEWVIQFKLSEPEKYLFNVRDADETLRDASESVMRAVVGDRTVDEVITVGRAEIAEECKSKLKELVELYDMGISIDQVQLITVNPPKPVQASFNEVNQAQQERENSINIALGEQNREIPKAGGEADKTISEAEGYAMQRINEAEGDAAKFNALFSEYLKAPEVTRRRIYLETMQDVMPNLGKKVIVDESANQVLPFLPLNSPAAK